MATNLKDLNLDPIVEKAFGEIDQKLGSLVNDEESFYDFLDSLDENYVDAVAKELKDKGHPDDYVVEQFGKGMTYLFEKYQSIILK